MAVSKSLYKLTYSLQNIFITKSNSNVYGVPFSCLAVLLQFHVYFSLNNIIRYYILYTYVFSCALLSNIHTEPMKKSSRLTSGACSLLPIGACRFGISSVFFRYFVVIDIKCKCLILIRFFFHLKNRPYETH